jgi:VIT family
VLDAGTRSARSLLVNTAGTVPWAHEHNSSCLRVLEGPSDVHLEAETANGTMGTMSGVVVKPAQASSGDGQGPDEPHHRDVQGGASRAAVFGISDGLLTNISLILGVAGAHPAAGVVRLAGFAGLVAGAFSMAAGEYVSMTV